MLALKGMLEFFWPKSSSSRLRNFKLFPGKIKIFAKKMRQVRDFQILLLCASVIKSGGFHPDRKSVV